MSMMPQKNATGKVASGSQTGSASANQLAAGATEQAGSVEEITSSMEEMSASVARNADGGRETTAIAEKALSDAREGGKALVQTVRAMRDVAGRIGVVEEIARQTNTPAPTRSPAPFSSA